MSNLHSALVTDLGIFAANTQHLSPNLASNKYFQYYMQSYLWAFFKFQQFSSEFFAVVLSLTSWQL